MQSHHKVRLLFIVLPSWDMPVLTGVIKKELEAHTSHYHIVKSRDEYFAMKPEERYSFEVLAVWGLPGFAKALVSDQIDNSKAFKYMHSLSVGCDEYCSVKNFRESSIPLTNAKGAFSDVLAEYVLAGILYHAKHIPSFQKKREMQKWQIEPVELVSSKTLVVVGYGDIGSRCARMCKLAFGMKTIGVNKFPKLVTPEQAQWVDKVVGLEEYDKYIAEADFVLGSLPKMVQTNDFFNMTNCFSKMKKSAVFMNIGRGTTVDESDLADALYSGQIAGAVLDVFKVEPMALDNRLWQAPNLFMTPHCADQDSEWLQRTMKIFGGNLVKYVKKQPLHNIVDKQFTYSGSKPKL